MDKLSIKHLNHTGPLGLAFLTSMLKTALNTKIKPHIWKLTNIVPIPKLNKDIDKGTSYRPISLLSVIAKTLEKSLLPYITAYIRTGLYFLLDCSTLSSIFSLGLVSFEFYYSMCQVSF